MTEILIKKNKHTVKRGPNNAEPLRYVLRQFVFQTHRTTYFFVMRSNYMIKKKSKTLKDNNIIYRTKRNRRTRRTHVLRICTRRILIKRRVKFIIINDYENYDTAN